MTAQTIQDVSRCSADSRQLSCGWMRGKTVLLIGLLIYLCGINTEAVRSAETQLKFGQAVARYNEAAEYAENFVRLTRTTVLAMSLRHANSAFSKVWLGLELLNVSAVGVILDRARRLPGSGVSFMAWAKDVALTLVLGGSFKGKTGIEKWQRMSGILISPYLLVGASMLNNDWVDEGRADRLPVFVGLNGLKILMDLVFYYAKFSI